MEKGPKIVLWDIETSHNLVAAFNLYQDYIQPENILKERYVVSAAWKELGAKTVEAVSLLDDPKRFRKNPEDDYYVLTTLHGVLSEADVIVAHNGDKYDIKFTEGRMLFHGLSPLPPIMKLDTLKTAKARFLLNSNKLDYLAKFLGGKGKKPTPKGLWLQVLQHDPEAIREMVEYNKQDVSELEFVFNKLAPYMDNHVNRQLFPVGKKKSEGETCPRCGSDYVHARGFHRSITQVYQRFQCLDCGGWFRHKKADTAIKAQSRVL